ncbi:uncharacterized protein At4g15970-like [Quercus robur]|uniref:uncharacterized protein At4g15970-like n=1 Tax=Quercus robur TaxID=38942 RepID=UPI0021632C16|nr:uncharacterized protein At4g15970-like [Quercus robur]
MGGSRLIKPVVAFLIVFVVCLLFYRSSLSTGVTGKKWLLNFRSNSESNDLSQVLRSASTEARTVILTILDETLASPGSVLDLFLESFRIGQKTQQFLNHIVVVAVDNQAYQYCISIHPHCFQFTSVTSKLAKRKGSTSPDHLTLKIMRFDLFLEVVKLGYNFAFTEADVMWLRNPFEHFDNVKTITLACGSNPQGGNSTMIDKGLFFMKADEISFEFLKILRFERVLFPNYLDNSICEMVTHKLKGYSVKHLDITYFGGFCEPSKNVSKVYTMQSTCCDNVKSKVHDLRLVLDDWINFTAQVSTNASTGTTPFTWRAPKKCVG